MEFIETPIVGAFIIESCPHKDERGQFSRLYCENEFEAQGLAPCCAQTNLSVNPHFGTLRGMHFQLSPHEETKLVRCVKGEVWDVIVDIRPASTTFRKVFEISLRAGDNRSLYIPEGCAHGFLTLAPDTEVLYQMGSFFEPGYGSGFRWDDPAFNIQWPEPPSLISEKDLSYPAFQNVPASS